ncbi:lipid droplet-associated protein [Amycolatopsis sp. FDAARGOS 1241]|uniref:lipid droplet-associated protein n=1 Tax=Amycolatopsis sp. FDAARGOS 1241 TaxID=2778070 RepID=UPI001950761C|nr:lipid droplet-associated protein [Amycolatopsis sp. FDAARGOS 1241]QRP47214.1 lipid droplet-associated protein [Amycolatopsis sp. FDAARGOS 1241]
MKPLPLPLRVAAGLAVTTAERVRELPKQITGLPVTVVSQVLQLSMRVQQQVTELAIKGDGALSALRPVEDTPSWATFDEDIEPDLPPTRPTLVPVDDLPEPQANGHRPNLPPLTDTPDTEVAGDTEDPWSQEERALAQDHAEGENDSTGGGPASLANYDELTLPQLRARLRRLTVPQLEELLEYEKANADRASFVGMLARRIGNARKAEEAGQQGDDAEGQ